ncbi:MAG: hypothetical protein M1834_002677 [Cirrosporium novae-zelandiae]|nr:MAG: hypothetical protein M1834_002677 [Cirrosporium novae-zelandiae]
MAEPVHLESAPADTPSTVDKMKARQYHHFKYAVYFFPNDPIEVKRLALQHHMWVLTLNHTLHLSPLSRPLNVLDIGTGTGNWAIDFAEAYPNAQILGTDLSPIQPARTPSNCSFKVENSELPWSHNIKFDFIHSRALVAALKDWPGFFRQCFENSNPGGWVECHEIVPTALDACCDDGTVKDDHFVIRLTKLMNEAGQKLGMDMNKTNELKNMMRHAGFEDVRQVIFKWPWGGWPTDEPLHTLGELFKQNMLELGGLEVLTVMLFTKALGWPREKMEAFLQEGRESLEDHSQHYYNTVIAVYGRKPDLDEKK